MRVFHLASLDLLWSSRDYNGTRGFVCNEFASNGKTLVENFICAHTLIIIYIYRYIYIFDVGLFPSHPQYICLSWVMYFISN